MSEQTQETNETLSTPSQEQQATEKTTEEQFYGSTEENAKEQSEVKTAADSEKPQGEEVAKSEDVKDEEGSGDSKEETKAEDKEGDEWSLELPEDSFVSEEGLKEIESFAKENKLSKEAASKLLERENKAVSDFVNKQQADMDAELETWREAVVNDSTMGGENLKTTVENARRVVDQFGNEEFISLLRDTGYGDNPEVVRFLSKIGKLMSDDSLVTPQGKKENKSIEELFYGSNN